MSALAHGGHWTAPIPDSKHLPIVSGSRGYVGMAMTIWIVSPPGYPHSQAFDEVAIASSAAFRLLGKEVPIVRDAAHCGGTAIVLDVTFCLTCARLQVG